MPAVLKLAVMVQGLTHVVTVTSLIVLERRQLSIELAHHALDIVILAHLERKHAQCFTVLASCDLG